MTIKSLFISRDGLFKTEQTMRYIVLDSLGNVMGKFPNYQQASTFKFARGNHGWSIIKY